MELKGAKVCVCGARGFLGRHLVAELDRRGADVIKVQRKHTNLQQFPEAYAAIGGCDFVFNLAGVNGGLGAYSKHNSWVIFSSNTLMALNVIQASLMQGVKKVVSVVASCAYGNHTHGYGNRAKRAEGVLFEEDFFEEIPHPTVEAHGWAKRNLQLATKFAAQQHGLNAVCACPTTLFGPGDTFDLERSKVVGSLVRRFQDAIWQGAKEVVCWGSGKPLREVMYVEDAAKLLVETLIHYEDPNIPLNLGTGQEFSIKEIAEAVAEEVGFKGAILWDKTKPDGQMRKRLDLALMRKILPAFAPTPFRDALRRTIKYYQSFCETAA